MQIDAHTQQVALLGFPVAHSLSPLIHNTAFQHQHLNYCYTAHSVEPAHLADAVAGLRALKFAGANVTLPHKTNVLPLMHTLSPEAKAVGAVNTIVCKKGKLHGDNTDIAGFLHPLYPFSDQLQEADMLVFGAGGAARAVLYALLTTFRPKHLYIVVRNVIKAEGLIAGLAGHDIYNVCQVVSLTQAQDAVRASRLLVNATPCGMHPHTKTTVWPNPSDFGPHQIAYDLVYNPVQTHFLYEAGHRGAKTIDGLEMFIGQAAAAYTQWTNHDMPIAPVRKVLQERLGKPV